MYDKWWFTFIFIVLSDALVADGDALRIVCHVCSASVKLCTCCVFFWFRGLRFPLSRLPITKLFRSKCVTNLTLRRLFIYCTRRVWAACSLGMLRALTMGRWMEKEVLMKGVSTRGSVIICQVQPKIHHFAISLIDFVCTNGLQCARSIKWFNRNNNNGKIHFVNWIETYYKHVFMHSHSTKSPLHTFNRQNWIHLVALGGCVWENINGSDGDDDNGKKRIKEKHWNEHKKHTHSLHAPVLSTHGARARFTLFA